MQHALVRWLRVTLHMSVRISKVYFSESTIYSIVLTAICRAPAGLISGSNPFWARFVLLATQVVFAFLRRRKRLVRTHARRGTLLLQY